MSINLGASFLDFSLIPSSIDNACSKPPPNNFDTSFLRHTINNQPISYGDKLSMEQVVSHTIAGAPNPNTGKGTLDYTQVLSYGDSSIMASSILPPHKASYQTLNSSGTRSARSDQRKWQ